MNVWIAGRLVRGSFSETFTHSVFTAVLQGFKERQHHGLEVWYRHNSLFTALPGSSKGFIEIPLANLLGSDACGEESITSWPARLGPSSPARGTAGLVMCGQKAFADTMN
jgi:hypothetical protein